MWREKTFFFPPYDSFCRLSTEARRREEKRADHNYFSTPLPRPNPTLSPAAAHRQETKPFVQSLPLDLIDHPPPWRRFVSTAAAATSRRIDTTVVDAMPTSPNGIVTDRGRTRDGKRVRVPARVAKGPRAKKRSFSRDDRLARANFLPHRRFYVAKF